MRRSIQSLLHGGDHRLMFATLAELRKAGASADPMQVRRHRRRGDRRHGPSAHGRRTFPDCVIFIVFQGVCGFRCLLTLNPRDVNTTLIGCEHAPYLGNEARQLSREIGMVRSGANEIQQFLGDDIIERRLQAIAEFDVLSLKLLFPTLVHFASTHELVLTSKMLAHRVGCLGSSRSSASAVSPCTSSRIRFSVISERYSEKRGAQVLELRPEDLVDEAPRRFDDNGLSVHPPISKWVDPITTAERNEELPGPNVRDREFYLHGRFVAGGLPRRARIRSAAAPAAAFSPAVAAPAKRTSIFLSFCRSSSSAEDFPIMGSHFPQHFRCRKAKRIEH